MKTLKLYGKYGKGKVTLVDNDIYEKVKDINWCVTSTGYVARTTHGKTIYLHRIILGTPKGLVSDHINRNKLDNRRENLRACTGSINCLNSDKKKNNTSGYKGVTFWKRDNKWKAQIKINRVNHHIGYFDTKEEAAKAYQNYL